MSEDWGGTKKPGATKRVVKPTGTKSPAATALGSSRERIEPGKRIMSSSFDRMERSMGTAAKISDTDSLDKEFMRASPTRQRTHGEYDAVTGPTFSGKTFLLLSFVKRNAKGIEQEVPTWNLPSKSHEKVIETMKAALKDRRFQPVDRLYVIGTEEGTEETLYSDDNAEFFNGWYDKISIKEIYSKTKSDDMLEVSMDVVQSVTDLNKVLILFERAVDDDIKKKLAGTLTDDTYPNRAFAIDGGSPFRLWHNEVLRQKVMGYKITRKERGVPPYYWSWRGIKLETLALDFKKSNVPFVVSYKMVKDQETGLPSTVQPDWYDPVSGHYASIWINSILVGQTQYSQFMKCRPRKTLVGKVYPMMTANLLLALCLGLENELGDRAVAPRDAIDKFGQEEVRETRDDDENEEEKEK